jgi:hypothetical protein
LFLKKKPSLKTNGAGHPGQPLGLFQLIRLFHFTRTFYSYEHHAGFAQCIAIKTKYEHDHFIFCNAEKLQMI